MPVSALELKPRGTVALYDAAIRLCARTSGVWALTLPTGALLTWSVFALAHAIERNQNALVPSLAVAGAWGLRAIGMGAASWYAEQQVVGREEPTTWQAWKRALARAPSLLVTAAYCLVLNGTLAVFSLGLGLLFLGAHQAAYAVAMRGEGHPLALYGTASKLLGPARHTGAWLRLTVLVQLLMFFNLHLLVNVGVYLAKSLLALNLSFVGRFASFDNPTWLATLAVVTFTLFEPVRAAASALLLVDGRVRQEGLDLKARVEQLPKRVRRTVGAVAGLVAVLLAGTGWAQTPAVDDWSGTYRPGEARTLPESAMRARLEAVVQECGLGDLSGLGDRLEAVDRVAKTQPAATARFVARVERTLEEDDGCDLAEAELEKGLALVAEASTTEAANAEARAKAEAILARPEFEKIEAPPPTPEAPKDEGPSSFSKWWDEIWEAIVRWLKRRPKDAPEPSSPVLAGGEAFAQAIVVLAIGLVLAVIAVVVVRLLRDRRPPDDAGEAVGGAVSPLPEHDAMSALTRPPESWAGLADQLAAKGEYREAIRHLYLALLSRLHRDGAIDYDPAKSNWDYLKAFKGPSTVKSPFRELTRRFDFAWYGRLEADPASWRTFRGLTEPLLSPTEAAAS